MLLEATKCGKLLCYAAAMQFIFYLSTWDHGLAHPTEPGINKQYPMVNLECMVTACMIEMQEAASPEERLEDTGNTPRSHLVCVGTLEE